jgi:hypothetical protein
MLTTFSFSLALMTSPLLDEITSKQGCAPKLLGMEAHRFIEAQIACDVFFGMAIVNQTIAGSREATEAAQILRRLLADAQGRGRAPFARSPKSVLRRGYELLLYAGLARVGTLEEHEVSSFDALATMLAQDVNAAAPAFIESFHDAFWPCDSAPAAAALILHGKLRGNDMTMAAGTALVQRLERLRETGFVTRVDRRGKVLEPTPRGTVMAWTAGFLALADVRAARVFADDFFERFCVRDARIFGLDAKLACREWPKGNARAADSVSGPIVDGYGTGASALGIAALRASGREDDADRLTELSSLAGAALAKQFGPLENAILLWGATARPWR